MKWRLYFHGSFQRDLKSYKLEESEVLPSVGTIDDNDEKCGGAIRFIFAKTREECNNLYYKDKDYWDNFKA